MPLTNEPQANTSPLDAPYICGYHTDVLIETDNGWIPSGMTPMKANFFKGYPITADYDSTQYPGYILCNERQDFYNFPYMNHGTVLLD